MQAFTESTVNTAVVQEIVRLVECIISFQASRFLW